MELEDVRTVDQAIEDAVGERGVTDDLVPLVDRRGIVKSRVLSSESGGFLDSVDKLDSLGNIG